MDVIGILHVPAVLALGKKRSTHCTRGCLGPTTCLDLFEKEKFFPMLAFGPRIFSKITAIRQLSRIH